MAEITGCHPDMVLFWRLMAEGVCSGRPLLSLLYSVGRELPPEPMGNAVAALAKHVDEGKTLSEAMAAIPSVFSKAHVCLVEAGEYLGRLDRLLVLILEFTWACPACGHLQFPASRRTSDGKAEQKIATR